MKYRVDFCDMDGDYMSGRCTDIEARNPHDALKRAQAQAKPKEDIRQIVETKKRPKELGFRIVYDYMNGFFDYET